MEYGKIISTGWSQAWKHKTLWIFGFLIAGGGGGNIFRLSDKFDSFGMRGYDLYRVKEFIAANIFIILMLLVLAFVLFIIWIILSTISQGGLINAAGQFKANDPYSFGKAFRVGASFFWRIFGIGLLSFVVIMAYIIILVLLGVAAFVIHVALGIISLLVLLPLLIGGIFVAAITVALAERIIVLEDRPVFDSIGDSYTLWKSNLGPAVVYSLIYIGLGIAVGLSGLVILLFTAAPFIAMGFVNLLMALLLGIPLVLLILLVIEGFSGSAMHLMTTEFYYQLSGLSKNAAIQPADPGSGYSSPPPPPPVH